MQACPIVFVRVSHACARIISVYEKGRILVNTVLFDMDGTLLDTLEDLHVSTNWALQQSGLPPITAEEMRLAAGYGSIVLTEKAVKGAFAEGTPEFQRVHDAFIAHYHEHCDDNTKPYEGIMELLEALQQRGVKMGIVSNKIDPDVEGLRKQWFEQYIPLGIGRSDDIPKKPAPDMALMALEQLGSTVDQAVYVGDSEPDAQIARNAGCLSACALWGFRTRKELEPEQPDFLINHPLDLLNVIDEVNHGR